MASTRAMYGEQPAWEVVRPRFNAFRLLVSWVLSALALLAAAWIVPGADVKNFPSALAAAAVIAALNAILPPVVAAVRLPFVAALGFLVLLVVDALMLLAADAITDGDLTVDSFWSALGVALAAAAIGVILDIVFGTNDDDTYTFRVIQRIARRSGEREATDVPGIVFLEIDGLALPVLQRAIRNGSAPTMGRWLGEGSHHLVEWETDLSSQTGASQAGILLGSNDDIPAFRWVEKETATLMVCSAPADCEEIERRHRCGRGLLANGGASRGNLLSGEADHVILTASRSEAERHANPGYRAFYANGFNVLRSLVLFFWEVVLEVSAALRASRRDVQPRGHRGGYYPLLRAALCVVVRDLIVYGVLSDMMKGRPAIYATFSSYDEVAHHSGLERSDTMEALRKLDQQFGRIERARRYAARPYEIVVLSDHGQTQGATFKQRNGYGLDELVQRSVEQAEVADVGTGDENQATVGRAVDEASGHKSKKPSKKDVSGRDLVVLGSGNLGLIYLLGERHRLTLEEIDAQHPRLVP
ncbi:MAG TPA: phage holin family protein, partial [Gaiellaceae bacterium]|nr:phage holin family protein [Gaiellaceae bacterium]